MGSIFWHNLASMRDAADDFVADYCHSTAQLIFIAFVHIAFLFASINCLLFLLFAPALTSHIVTVSVCVVIVAAMPYTVPRMIFVADAAFWHLTQK
jgi:hypothetical protein